MSRLVAWFRSLLAHLRLDEGVYELVVLPNGDHLARFTAGRHTVSVQARTRARALELLEHEIRVWRWFEARRGRWR